MPILVAIDGSSQTDAGLRLAAQIAGRGQMPLTILTVIKHGAGGQTPSAELLLHRAVEIVHSQLDTVRTAVRVGHPATEIVREAEQGHYDLVIVGERPNRNLVSRFLAGSTAVRVVEHAPCPVIVAKGTIRPITRILLCDSGSGDPSVSLPSPPQARFRALPSVLRRFADLRVDLLQGTEEIVVLHVMSQMSAGPGVRGKQLRGDTEELIEERTPEGELLHRDVGTLTALGIRAIPRVRHGLVVEEILDEVRDRDYDLVVIGAYRGEGWQRILLDDLTHRLIVELDRPVLVVR